MNTSALGSLGTLTLTLALGAAACSPASGETESSASSLGGAGGAGPSSSDDAADGFTTDSQGLGGATAEATPSAPSIVSSSPADGDAGVLPEASLVVEFDLPMNQESVEAAFSSEQLGAEAVQMSWNDAGTVLTIDPVEPLSFDYGEAGADLELIANIEAVAYGFSIGEEAESKDGVPLGAPLEVAFTVARGVVQNEALGGKLSGSVRSDEKNFPNFWVGDSAYQEEGGADAHYIAVVTFDIGELPEDIVAFDTVKLSFTQELNNGTPYESLGTDGDGFIEAFDANYGTKKTYLDVSSSLGDSIGVLSDGLDSFVSIDVTDSLLADYGTSSFSQWALRFPGNTNDDGIHDNVELTEAELDILYYVP